MYLLLQTFKNQTVKKCIKENLSVFFGMSFLFGILPFLQISFPYVNLQVRGPWPGPRAWHPGRWGLGGTPLRGRHRQLVGLRVQDKRAHLEGRVVRLLNVLRVWEIVCFFKKIVHYVIRSIGLDVGDRLRSGAKKVKFVVNGPLPGEFENNNIFLEKK